MSNRRMISNRIANSARFLQMPTESQLLYFHMIIRADDDGVVESYPVMRLLGIAPDNYKVLLAKGLIQELNDDQVIVITDWLEHNVIRADRKVDSVYKNLLPKTIKTIEAKPRIDVIDNSKRLGGQSTDGIREVKLSKDKKESSLSYLLNIPEIDTQQFVERFEITPRKVKDKAESLHLYCKSKGKIYKDYKSFLLNAIKKDFSERVKHNCKIQEKEIEMTSEQKERVRLQMEEIRNKMKI